METSPKEMSITRKRRSRSNSPSEDIAEQNLKRKRFDNGEEISPNEITNEHTSLSEKSENGSIDVSIDVKNDSTSVIKGEIETVKNQESKYCSNESKIQTNKDKPDNGNKMDILTEQREISEAATTNETKCNNTDDKTIINISEEKSEEFTKIEGTNQGLVENKKYEDKIVLESKEEEKAEVKISETPTLSSDTDEDTTLDKEKLSKTLEHTPTKKLNQETPNKKLTPKQMQKKLEAEKRNQEKQKDKEERMKKKLEEKERIIQEKLKKKEMKEKEIELKKKERDEKEEKKRKEREEKEQKRKEKEEMEELKRKEREQEKQKKLQEIEEKNIEKLKEEEKKQKAVAAFVNFFVPKKSEETQRVQTSNFLEFEVKSDMKLPLPRRETLSTKEKEKLEYSIQNQNENASYLKDLLSGKLIGKSLKTWPYKEAIDDDVVVVEDLGESIYEDKSSLQRHRAKFLYFHENRRPAYYGTWRKNSKFVLPRKPFGEDKKLLNYEEDSDDDWEEEEQGESLNGSEDEADKEIEDEKDDYEVDNEFFVPHGHLSDDEVDDEEMARLSPDSLKQKLKLLKEEFDQDMKLKTLKLKPRSIGCIWYNKEGTNVEDPVNKYLQPLAIITRHTQIIIKSRIDIASLAREKKNKIIKELDPELIPSLLKILHGSSKKKSMLVEQFLTENQLNVSKGFLMRQLKECAIWEKYKDEETKRYKFRWVVHQELREKYNLV